MGARSTGCKTKRILKNWAKNPKKVAEIYLFLTIRNGISCEQAIRVKHKQLRCI